MMQMVLASHCKHALPVKCHFVLKELRQNNCALSVLGALTSILLLCAIWARIAQLVRTCGLCVQRRCIVKHLVKCDSVLKAITAQKVSVDVSSRWLLDAQEAVTLLQAPFPR